MGSQESKGKLPKTWSQFCRSFNRLRDPLSTTGRDPDTSDDEDRYITFGMSARGRLLVVAHTERNEKIRIISARRATRSERSIYEEG